MAPSKPSSSSSSEASTSPKSLREIGAPKTRTSSHIFSFGVEEPSSDSDDSDYFEEAEEAEGSPSGQRLKRKMEGRRVQGKGKDRSLLDREGRPARAKRLRRAFKPRENGGGGQGATDWATLPLELLETIFLFALSNGPGSFPLIPRLSRVCKSWRAASHSPYLLLHANLSPQVKGMTATSLKVLLSTYDLSQTRQMDLSLGSQLTDQVFDLLLASCPRLEALSLEGCDKLTPEGLLRLPAGCPHLRSLNLSARQLAKAQVLQRVAQELGPRLEELTVQNQSHVLALPGSVFKALATHCPSLRILNLGGSLLSRVNLAQLQRGCPLLTELDLRTCKMDWQSNGLDDAPGFPSLRILSVAGTQVPMPWEALLHAADRLEVLDLRHCQSFSPEVAARLPLKELRVLLLRNALKLRSEALGNLLRSCGGSLEQLDVGNTGLEDDAALSIAHHCKSLKELDLTGCHLTEEGLKEVVRNCKKLEKLTLTSCRGVPRELRQSLAKGDLSQLAQQLDKD